MKNHNITVEIEVAGLTPEFISRVLLDPDKGSIVPTIELAVRDYLKEHYALYLNQKLEQFNPTIILECTYH